MTSPTNEYLEKDRKATEILENILTITNKLETRFECSRVAQPIAEKGFLPASRLPDFVGFYDKDKKVGGLYFLEEPVRIEVLDSSFELYADAIREAYNI